MDQRSVFFDEWLSSLRAQYQHVVRVDDKVTLPSLTAVLQQVGFGEGELRQLRLEATLHVDDVAGDFVPDLTILAEDKPAGAHPAECLCPDCAPIDESQFDADGQPLPPDPDAAAHDSGHVFPVAEVEADEAEPETYADSLAWQASSENETMPNDEDDDPPEDPDAPQQSSLF